MRWSRLEQVGAVALIALLTIVLVVSVIYLTSPDNLWLRFDAAGVIAAREVRQAQLELKASKRGSLTKIGRPVTPWVEAKGRTDVRIRHEVELTRFWRGPANP
jgi:hypothetical protein